MAATTPSPSPARMAGFAALEDRLKLKPVQPLTTTSRIGRSRATQARDGFRVETYPPQYEPEDSLRGHFEFGLKYDDLNLEWLSRFFASEAPAWIAEWVRERPTSQYARRAGFLYEWFTGETLDVPDTPTANYVAAIDPQRYLTATTGDRDRRWRVVNTLPGTPDFCPLVRLTPELQEAAAFDMHAELQRLEDRFGADLLMRTASWLSFAESRASFAIEREADREKDIKRFAVALAEHCGRIEEPLSTASLVTIQNVVLGSRALRTGIRKSPVFVGTPTMHSATVVHYIAPPASELGEMMQGLRAFERRTRGAPSLLRAGALSFGFVYIHPLADGNGRLHRLLVNDTLMRDGQVPTGVIVPISSTIIGSSKQRGDYERVLERFSAPFIRRYATAYRFTAEQRVCEDGVATDFEFDAEADALHAWRFPDLTDHALYMARVVRDTVLHGMTDEATFLARHDEARRRLKGIFEMPDLDADAIVRSLRENNGRVSNKLRERYPSLFGDEELQGQILDAVMSGLQNDFDEHRDEEVATERPRR